MINILTDSCADLSQDLIDKYQIGVIPLPVFINNQSYRDGVDIKTSELFSLVDQTHQLPKTSAPSIADFQKLFERSGESIFIGISSKLSITVSNAILARQNIEGHSIRVIDSKNLSSGIGLLVLRAAELRDQGLSAEQIERTIQKDVERVHSSFVIDTLDYLYMGGRCSAMTHIVGSLLKIRPVIEVRADGTLGVREKIRGSRKHALDSMLTEIKNHLSTLDLHRVFVTHTGCDADAQYLVDALREMAPIEDIQTAVAGSTIASHCGPDTIGILYLTK